MEKNMRGSEFLVFPHCALTLFLQKYRESNDFGKEITK